MARSTAAPGGKGASREAAGPFCIAVPSRDPGPMTGTAPVTRGMHWDHRTPSPAAGTLPVLVRAASWGNPSAQGGWKSAQSLDGGSEYSVGDGRAFGQAAGITVSPRVSE